MIDKCFMIVGDLILPIIEIITGRILWKHSSIDIDIRISRRSTAFMKDEEKKKRVRERQGKLSWKLGWTLLIFTVVIHILFFGSSEDMMRIVEIALSAIQTVSLLCSVGFIEKVWKKMERED